MSGELLPLIFAVAFSDSWEQINSANKSIFIYAVIRSAATVRRSLIVATAEASSGAGSPSPPPARGVGVGVGGGGNFVGIINNTC